MGAGDVDLNAVGDTGNDFCGWDGMFAGKMLKRRGDA